MKIRHIRNIINVRAFVKRNSISLKISLFNAIVIFLLCYFVDNLPYSFVGDATLGQHFEQIKQFFNPKESELPQNLLLINVAYDRQLADVLDEFGLPKGNIDITDRKKLLSLLLELKKSDYRYILLDVSFSDSFQAPQDSTLFRVISSLNNLVISKSENFKLADTCLLSKARYSDYSTHISESNFVKYELIRNGEPTMPYQVYMDLYGKTITSFAGFYFFNGKLATKSVVLRFPIKLWNKIADSSDEYDIAQLQYYNLGSDILDMGINISELAKDKIVVIGDFCENDIHDTYIGKISGPVININAFYALVNDNLSIPFYEIAFLVILYFNISVAVKNK